MLLTFCWLYNIMTHKLLWPYNFICHYIYFNLLIKRPLVYTFSVLFLPHRKVLLLQPLPSFPQTWKAHSIISLTQWRVSPNQPGTITNLHYLFHSFPTRPLSTLPRPPQHDSRRGPPSKPQISSPIPPNPNYRNPIQFVSFWFWVILVCDGKVEMQKQSSTQLTNNLLLHW